MRSYLIHLCFTRYIITGVEECTMNRREFLKTGMAGIAFLSLKTLGLADPVPVPIIMWVMSST